MKLFSLFFLLLFTGICWGQTHISGVVKDGKGTPVPFVNIRFVNTNTGTTSNENGRFRLSSADEHRAAEFSFIGYKTLIVQLEKGNTLAMEVVLEEQVEDLAEVTVYRGKTSKKNNPAVDILRKIWENRRESGVKKFDQYEYTKYEKLEFDLNSIDSSVIKNRAFGEMGFIFDHIDTSVITGKNYLPLFLNESVHRVYGDNVRGRSREDLLGNKNSGLGDNQMFIAGIQNLYLEMDIYDNYLRIFEKNFISPLSTTGIHNYNYVLQDSAMVKDKWSYNIIYYPRRPNELTFKGNFWVNDTTWAISHIKMESTGDANLNWINSLYLERDYEVYNDSVFLLQREFFMADFSFEKKPNSRGIFGKKTVVYDNYRFDNPLPSQFYNERVTKFNEAVYNREDEFWQQNRLEPLSRNEKGIYQMHDSLAGSNRFKRMYRLASIAASGYVEFDGWDFGPVHNLLGYNTIEGYRVRAGARTFRGQHDSWRLEGYGAYGFRDRAFKYGILAKAMLDHRSRLIISAGYRDDLEQMGASLTNSTDVLGRSLASASLLNVGDNEKLTHIKLATAAVEAEPLQNLTFRLSGSHRRMNPASNAFSLSYFVDEDRTAIATGIEQVELSGAIGFYPGRKMAGYGVDRLVTEPRIFPTFFLNYSRGIKGVLNSDFDYERLQFYYDQPLWIGGIGISNVSMEAGKTFGTVPLGILHVIPGNQTYFALYNTFPLLNFYEFVTDTYVTAHFEHNFNGLIFSRIPGVRNWNLREFVGIRGAWGELSEDNKNIDASGLPLMAPSNKPYYEYSAGVGNIFRFLRIDAHFRGNYFNNRDARSFGVTASFGFHF